MKTAMRSVGATIVVTAAVGVGAVGLGAAPASAAAVPKCNSATSYAGAQMPGVNGKRVSCYISKGSRGATVKVLQRFLSSAPGGSTLAVDGSYGPATQRAVAAYQRAWNGYPCADSAAIRKIRLSVDGSWGPQTSRISQNQKEWCGD